ncbi:MAG: hypothetical protein JJU29_16540 [Verrucomicrobia bacterium]|nr:hypothetical protein [Verrucomicrobiota bacterium]MCH8513680.1 hypothetical protein [Kiritimatiellia bacterium]
MPIPPPPPLWWNPTRMDAIRKALAEGDPRLDFLLAQTRAKNEGGEEDGCYALEPKAVCAWLDEDAETANEVLRKWSELAQSVPNNNLGEAGWALSGAVILDILSDLVNDLVRDEAVRVLWQLVKKLRMPTTGNPHVVTNNWWAVTHGGALCAALAAGRFSSPETPGADPDAVAWAYGRLQAFAQHFGPSGLYHEGLGYIRYTSIFLLAAITAARAQGLEDLLETFPNLRQMLPSLYAALIARENRDDNVNARPQSGGSLSWNDMGTGAGCSAVDHMGMAIAPPHLQPSLKAWFDHALGEKAQHPSLGGHHSCVPMAWAFYPYDLPAPDFIDLPTRVCDSRQGFWVVRNRYADENDVVFGLYAKHSHAGGHAHEDAGSIRLAAFGYDWICGPGQARTARSGQSVAFPDSFPQKTPNLAFMNFQENLDTGIRAGIDMRKTSGAYHERYLGLDWSPAGSSTLALAMLDQIDDHLKRPWHWHWIFDPKLQGEIEPDQRGVILRAPNGMCARIRFLAAKPDSLTLGELPASQRTYASGNTEHYRGKPCIQARFAPSDHLSIFVVAAWQLHEPPEISGDLHDIRLAGAQWPRPFGAAIPSGFIPNLSPGPSQHSAP